jgi:hypothetical protein
MRITVRRFAILTFAAGFLGIFGPGSWAQDQLVISAGDCQWLTRHHPAPDVAYQPGVDVRGKKVAPADLNGGYPDIKVPEEITFEVTAELKRYLESAASGRFAGEAVLGRVTVKDEKVYFNGQLIADTAAHAIAEECRRLQQEQQENGQ